jgi:hypothetical protein
MGLTYQSKFTRFKVTCLFLIFAFQVKPTVLTALLLLHDIYY